MALTIENARRFELIANAEIKASGILQLFQRCLPRFQTNGIIVC